MSCHAFGLEFTMRRDHRPKPQFDNALQRLARAAPNALDATLVAGVAAYDRASALRRFHRLDPETIASETPRAARTVLREIERALRAERARAGHWSYDLNRHIGLLVAYRAEKARLERISRGEKHHSAASVAIPRPTA
jgi:hypothetical protein